MRRIVMVGSDDDLAGFPDGRIFAFKLEEQSGNVFRDSVGNVPNIVGYTGIALDCATTSQYVVDGTGLRAIFNGAAPSMGVCFEVVTPALGTGTTQYLMGTAGTSTSAKGAFQITFTEAANLGAATNLYTVAVVARMTVDGGGTTTDHTVTLGSNAGLLPSTGYQFKGYLTAGVGVTPQWNFWYRKVGELEWKWMQSSAGTAPATSVVLYEGATSTSYRVGVVGTTTGQFKGLIRKVAVALGSFNEVTCGVPLETDVESEILAAYGTNGRCWHFAAGTGSSARENITGANVAITGGPTWATLSGLVTQACMGQGSPGSNYYGVRLGGEAGFTLAGKQAYSAAHSKALIGGANGWTVVATLRVGDNLPAAERTLAAITGPYRDGTTSTDPNVAAGVRFTLNASGSIAGRVKRSDNTNGSTNATVPLGAGARYASNGMWTTYAISCNAAGLLTGRRIAYDGSSVVTAGTATANLGYLGNTATIVQIGDASLDCDVNVRFIGAFDHEITDAELYRINAMVKYKSAPALWVDAAAAVAGNGSKQFPYASFAKALRVHQVAGVINLNGGSANQRISSIYSTSSLLKMPSTAGMELIGTNAPVIIPGGLADAGAYPLELQENATGTWIFRNIVFDATDATVNNGPGYTDGAVSGAAVILDGITRLEMYGCTTKNANKSAASNGTGLTSRAIENVIWDHTSIDNEEHAAYFRVAAASPGVPHTFDVRRFTASGNLEDGIKCTNEFSDGSDDDPPTPASRDAVYWQDIVLDRIHVAGGKNQILLDGVKRGTLTNFLCEGANGVLATTAGLSLGASYDYGQVEDLLIANGTIRDYGTTQGYAVKNVNSTGCVARNVVTGNCFADLYDPEGTLMSYYCSGNSGHATLLWPTGNSNDPAASISFATPSDAHITAGDGFEDGENLWNEADELHVDLAGAARSSSGAWNRGAY